MPPLSPKYLAADVRLLIIHGVSLWLHAERLELVDCRCAIDQHAWVISNLRDHFKGHVYLMGMKASQVGQPRPFNAH